MTSVNNDRLERKGRNLLMVKMIKQMRLVVGVAGITLMVGTNVGYAGCFPPERPAFVPGSLPLPPGFDCEEVAARLAGGLAYTKTRMKLRPEQLQAWDAFATRLAAVAQSAGPCGIDRPSLQGTPSAYTLLSEVSRALEIAAAGMREIKMSLDNLSPFLDGNQQMIIQENLVSLLPGPGMPRPPTPPFFPHQDSISRGLYELARCADTKVAAVSKSRDLMKWPSVESTMAPI